VRKRVCLRCVSILGYRDGVRVPSDANMIARRVKVFSNVEVDRASDGRRRYG
jgi:hypothetical protein